MAASPVYGEKIREAKKELSHIYYKYVCRLSERINCDEQMLKSVFDLFISAAVNCVIWDEKETDTEMSAIRVLHGVYKMDGVDHDVYVIAVKIQS